MYDELVKRLRARADREDAYYEHGGDVIREAADAIEELSKRVPPVPHGRLIDADALMRHCVMLPRDGGSLPVVYASYLRNAPTIIPAEGERNESP